MALVVTETGTDDVAQIILAGLMGTGKTEVGRRLARELGRPFVDVDRLIEARAGQSIPEIFAARGEDEFRELECAAVREAVTFTDAVLATGGGALVDAENRRRLLAAGVVIHLEAAPEAILERIGAAADRPLLAGLSREACLEKLRELLATRAPAYGAATHAVDTTGLDVDDVVGRVRELVGEA